MSTPSYPPYESSDSVWQGQNQSGSGVSSGGAYGSVSGPGSADPRRLQQNGFAVASLVLGIIGIFGAIPLVGLFFSPLLIIGFILGVVAIVLAYKNMRGRKVMSIIATILNALGMVAVVLSTIALFSAAEFASNTDGVVVYPPDSSASVSASPGGGASATAKSKVPAEHRAALDKAESYANTMNMSKAAVSKQLTSQFEKFSPEAAKYAVDNVKADWKKNALTTANEYQDTMNMSPEAIRKQLVSSVGEQFTKEEADYAVKNLDK